MWEDPIVADVHRIREKLAAQFNFDVTAVFADMRSRQAALGTRLVSPKRNAESPDAVDSGGRTTSEAKAIPAGAVSGN